ncbi:MAG: hypothetical protein ACTHKB_08940 [Burkholderiaceae bacterium]
MWKIKNATTRDTGSGKFGKFGKFGKCGKFGNGRRLTGHQANGLSRSRRSSSGFTDATPDIASAFRKRDRARRRGSASD